MTNQADKIKIAFNDICEQAKHNIEQHAACANKNRKYKNFHSLTVTLINIFTGSVLFFILQNKASDFITLLGSVLSFIAASCATINSYFRYPEKEASHNITVKRLEIYIFTCEQTVKRFNAGLINENDFNLLLQKHIDEYADIIKSGPTIPLRGKKFS